MGVAHDVAADNFVGVVLHDAFEVGIGSSFKSGIDFFHGGCFSDHGHDVGHRACSYRYAHGVCGNFAFQVGRYQHNRFGSTGAGGYYVLSSGTGTAQVAVRPVLQVLVGRVCVDGIHKKLLHTEGLIERHDHGHEAVGGAGGVGNNRVGIGDFVGIGTNNKRGYIVCFGWGRQHHAFGTSLQVQAGFFFIEENTRAFQHHIHLQCTPWAFSRIFDGCCVNLVSVDNQVIFFGGNGAFELTVHGVVFQQVRQCGVVRQVVDGHDFHRVVFH